MYPQVQALIMHRDPVEHARRRKPWNRAFSTNALKEYQPMIAKRVVQFVDGLSAQRDVVNLAAWISWFTYDFMSDMVSARSPCRSSISTEAVYQIRWWERDDEEQRRGRFLETPERRLRVRFPAHTLLFLLT